MSETIESDENHSRTAIESKVHLTTEISSEKSGEAVIFIISDNEKAARTSMRRNQTLALPMDPPVVIHLQDISEQDALFVVNNESALIEEKGSAYFQEGAIMIYVAESFTS